MTNYVAFFDADETVINMKTMFDFMQFFFSDSSFKGGEAGYQQVHARFRVMAETGVPREVINKEFYKEFKGVLKNDLTQSAKKWFESKWQHKADRFIEKSIAEIKKLQSEGFIIALVSGSFHDVLALFAAELGIEHILCAEFEIVNGVLTGELMSEPVIGQGKAKAVRDFLQTFNAHKDNCVAYGDNISDVPMLESVGIAKVVNPDLKLRKLAKQRGWVEL